MDKRKTLEDRAYDKVKHEFEVFISGIKTKSPDEIVEAAYEITYKQEILGMFEWEGEFNKEQCKAVLRTKNVLDFIYQKWLDYDGSVVETLEDSVKDSLDRRFDHIKSKTVEREGR